MSSRSESNRTVYRQHPLQRFAPRDLGWSHHQLNLRLRPDHRLGPRSHRARAGPMATLASVRELRAYFEYLVGIGHESRDTRLTPWQAARKAQTEERWINSAS